MISKVIEEAMENMVRRIEALEEFNKKYSSNQRPPKQFQQTKPGLASQGQVKYIRILGGDPWQEMTKGEAGKEIDRLLTEKAKNEYCREIEPIEDNEVNKNYKEPQVTEPKEVDTEDAGLDGEDLM